MRKAPSYPPFSPFRRRFLKGGLVLGSFLVLGTGGLLASRLFLPSLTTTDIGIISDLSWSPNGKYIAVAKGPEDRTTDNDLGHDLVGTYDIQIWDVTTGWLCLTYPTQASSLSWSPNSQWLASIGDHVEIWAGPNAGGISGGKPVTRLAQIGGPGPLDGSQVAWSPDGTRLAWGVNAEFSVWDVSRHKLLWREQKLGNRVAPLSWVADGQSIALSTMAGTGISAQWIGIVDASSGKELLHLDAQDNATYPMWSPDGHRLAVGDDSLRKVSILDVNLGKQVTSYQIDEWIQSIAWSPDSKRIATIGSTGRMHVWDLTTASLMITYASEPGLNGPLAWSPDGKYVVSVREDHFIQIQEIPPTRRGPTP